MRLFVEGQATLPSPRWEALFEISDRSWPEQESPHELFLRFSGDGLRLHHGADRKGLHIDGGEIERRLRGAFLLGRACGGPGRSVLDATAGFGVDGLALAARGCVVTLVERNAALWALLDDYLRRESPADVALLHADARTLGLEDLDAAPEVIYLDPMFPARGKGALPGKPMQYLRALELDGGDEGLELLGWALDLARDRVVLKRRRKDPLLADPSWQLKGSSVRYDVFSVRA
jgi:16S rRNA (guanine1516-N2)-methyltransferase